MANGSYFRFDVVSITKYAYYHNHQIISRASDFMAGCRYVLSQPNNKHNSFGSQLVYGVVLHWWVHDDLIKWKHFRVTGPLCGKFTGHRLIPRTKASDVELWYFLWSINGWVNTHESGDVRRHRAHYDVNVIEVPWTCQYYTNTNARFKIYVCGVQQDRNPSGT